MSGRSAEEVQIVELCKVLRLPALRRDAGRLAVEAARQGLGHLVFLKQLLETECSERIERRAARRIKEAGFPQIKTLESFDFSRAAHLPEALIRQLAEGRYIEAAEPVLCLGEPGTGKTHLAIALGVAAAQRGHSVRFVTVAQLATELVEARDARELGRVVARYNRAEVLILDELGYVPLSRVDAELLFRVLGERQERRPVIVTTNLPFGEWTQVFPDPRLCKAVVDRLTFRAHIIETGSESMRLQTSMSRRKGN
jgi:DNA replication protein DnaC